MKRICIITALFVYSISCLAADQITVNLPNLPSDAKPLEMVLIQPGTFMMGSPDSEQDRRSDEGPRHQVTITKPFYLGKHEVTQAQWQAVMGSNPSHFKGNNLPVESVIWDDCQNFIQKLNSLGQGTYRLPTEAEWEYACRAGTTTRFYWGDDLNYSEMYKYTWNYYIAENKTHEVGTKLPNAWGLYDMSGNVGEWCQDWYGIYSSSPQTDPAGASGGTFRAFRGGSWSSGGPWGHRSAYRYSYLINNEFVGGFRLVKELGSQPVVTPTPITTIAPTVTPTAVNNTNQIIIPLPNLPADAKPLEMVLIQPGTFMMGSPDSELSRDANEGPQHQVTITKPFYMGKYEVTQAQWQAVMGNNPEYWAGNNLPVETVSWDDCQTFIQKLNALGQGKYRLPTEAEWEYACRAGTTTRFYWGDDLNYTEISKYAWYMDNSANMPHEVGTKLPNPWNLYDMYGNVGERCLDWYGNYSSSLQNDPSGPNNGQYRVKRNGGYVSDAYGCRSARRIGNDWTGSYFGFRLVKEMGSQPVVTPTPITTIAPTVTPTAVNTADKITVPLPNLPANAKPLEMVKIPAGTFMMGSPASYQEPDEIPQHEVTITKDFYLGKYEVTQAQWQAVMGNNPSSGCGVGPNYPIYYISWNDCLTFIQKLNQLGQGTFRLPTEAEWEYACRAGTTTRFYWGDDSTGNQIGQYAWYTSNSGERTHEIGLMQPNAWGLFDMNGNVWEWCQDWFGNYSSNAQFDPSGPNSGAGRVFRGGSWRGSSRHDRTAFRYSDEPNSVWDDHGFRLAAIKSGQPSVLTPVPVVTPTPVLNPNQITVNLPSDVALDMVLINPGTFTMGSPSNEKDRSNNEGPQHQVTITKPFYMGKYEVTQAQWQSVMGSNPSNWKGNNLPVEQVSWDDCQAFIQNLNSLGQGTFRLPTEAEWEYACRAGTTTRFYWGDDLNYSQIGDYVWYYANSSSNTHEVGLKKPNLWGLFDMSGNVWEWCQDWYGIYTTNAQNDPSGVNSGSDRVYRGGSWYSDASICRSAFRVDSTPVSSNYSLGLRVIRSYDITNIPTPNNTAVPVNTPTKTSTPNVVVTATPTKTYTPTYTFTKTFTPTFTPTYTYTPSNTPLIAPTKVPSLDISIKVIDRSTFSAIPDTFIFYKINNLDLYAKTDQFGVADLKAIPLGALKIRVEKSGYTTLEKDIDISALTPILTVQLTPAVAPPTATFTPSNTPTATNTATYTPTATATFTPTATHTPVKTPVFTPTDTAAPTATPTFTPSNTPTPTPVLFEIPDNSIVVTDDLQNTDDLQGKFDVDAADHKALAIRWNFKNPAFTNYHIYVKKDNDKAEFLVALPADASYYEWRNPEFGHSYFFMIYGLINNVNPLLLESKEAVYYIAMGDNTPAPAAANTPVPTNTPVSVATPTSTNTPVATNTPAPTVTNTPTPLPNDILTLAVVSQERLKSLFGDDRVATLMAKLQVLLSNETVRGEIVDIDKITSIRDKFKAWDVDSSNLVKGTQTDPRENVKKANAVSEMIKAVIGSKRLEEKYAKVQYLIIIGSDAVVPFYRTSNQSRSASSEFNYYKTLDRTHPLAVALSQDDILTDDYYADSAPSWMNKETDLELYLPNELMTGRLVETPEEMATMMDAYLALNGQIDFDKALVAGSDTYSNGADVAEQILSNDLGQVERLSDESDDAQELADALKENNPVNIMGLHGTHAKMYRTKKMSPLTAKTAKNNIKDMRGAVVMNWGGHGGLNLDRRFVNPQLEYEDFAKVFCGSGVGAYLGTTAFSGSSQKSIGFSELLGLRFIDALISGTKSRTIGEAYRKAKQEYWLNESNGLAKSSLDLSEVIQNVADDTKILSGMVLYGLPMYRVTSSETGKMTPLSQSKEWENSLGMRMAKVKPKAIGKGLFEVQLKGSLEDTFMKENTTDAGKYFSFNGVTQTNVNEPVQPRVSFFTGAESFFPKGAVLESAKYDTKPNFDPVIEGGEWGPETGGEGIFTKKGFFPAIPFTVNTIAKSENVPPLQKFVFIAGQYNNDTKTERLYRELRYTTYYTGEQTDNTAPTVYEPTINVSDQAKVTVQGWDKDGDPLYRVVVVWTDGQGQWKSIDLDKSSTNAKEWSAEFAVKADMVFFLQAVDTLGNVAYLDNQGQYYPVKASQQEPEWNTVDFASVLKLPVEGFTAADLQTTSVPTDNAFDGATDGQGLKAVLQPGQGALLLASAPVATANGLVELKTSVRTTSNQIQLGLVAIAVPETGPDGSLGYVNPTGNEVPVDKWGEMDLVYDSPVKNYYPAIQFVLPKEAASAQTVYFDNLRYGDYVSKSGNPVAMAFDTAFDTINSALDTLNPFIFLDPSFNKGEISLTTGQNKQGILFNLLPNITSQVSRIGGFFSAPPQIPSLIETSLSVKKESAEDDGMFALAILDGEQTIAYYIKANHLLLNQFKQIQVGGNFSDPGQLVGPVVVIQHAGSGKAGKIIFDDLKVWRK